jgi:guanyl-specific ribonuclease Sa
VTPAVVRSIRRAAVGAAGGELDPATERTLQAARSGGAPLEAGVQRAMGLAFGVDFSAVRVHADATSTALNERIQAKAFTIGNDIFFRGGMPDATSRDGQELLAHELTHTVQQGAAVARQVDERVQRTPDTAATELVSLKAPPQTKGLKNWLKKKVEGDATWQTAFETRHGLDKDWYGAVTPIMQRLAKDQEEAAAFAAETAGLTAIPDFIAGTQKDHNSNIMGWVKFGTNDPTELGVRGTDGWFIFGSNPDMKVKIVGKRGADAQAWATDPAKGAPAAAQNGKTLKHHSATITPVNIDLAATIARIKAGTKLSPAHENDGSIFYNTRGLLPTRPAGYWTEYVVPPAAIKSLPAGTPAIAFPGPMRIVRGAFGEFYFTPDHYDSFTAIN